MLMCYVLCPVSTMQSKACYLDFVFCEINSSIKEKTIVSFKGCVTVQNMIFSLNSSKKFKKFCSIRSSVFFITIKGPRHKIRPHKSILVPSLKRTLPTCASCFSRFNILYFCRISRVRIRFFFGSRIPAF